MGRVKRSDIEGWLLSISIPVRDPGGDKIPVAFNVHAADIFQVRFYQKNSDKHERHCGNHRQIDERDTEQYLPKRLLYIVATNCHSFHTPPFSFFCIGQILFVIVKQHHATESKDRYFKKLYFANIYSWLPIMTTTRWITSPRSKGMMPLVTRCPSISTQATPRSQPFGFST